MSTAPLQDVRRTAADQVFERLHDDIISLKLEPGARVSEVEIARLLDVSRQPVREAFIRLHELSLLHVRPQRATEVRRISEHDIRCSRFIRTAIEVEVVRRACARETHFLNEEFTANLDAQQSAIAANDEKSFSALDYAFHELLCRAADCQCAFETISASKSQISRLCRLSFQNPDEHLMILDDHRSLFEHVRDGRFDDADTLIRSHLARLDETIANGRNRHPGFFEGTCA